MTNLRNLILLGILVFQLSACGSTDEDLDIPENIIAKNKMTLLLTDIHLAEALVTNARISSHDSSRVAFANVQKELFKKHKTDSLTYAKSYRFYSENPSVFKEMYRNVYSNLHKKDSLSKTDTDKKKEKIKIEERIDTSKQVRYPKDINIQKDIDAFKKRKRDKKLEKFNNSTIKKGSSDFLMKSSVF